MSYNPDIEFFNKADNLCTQIRNLNNNAFLFCCPCYKEIPIAHFIGDIEFKDLVVPDFCKKETKSKYHFISVNFEGTMFQVQYATWNELSR